MLLAALLSSGAETSSPIPALDEDRKNGSFYSQSSKPLEWVVKATKNWMAALPDSLPLNQISIPGSHDSGALHGGGLAMTQTWSIAEQLSAGIRFLDIRCRPVGKAFAIHHGIVYQKQSFEDVMDAIALFLRRQPKEVIVMRWTTQEHSPKKGSDPARVIARRYLRRYRALFYQDSDAIPALGKVRGKVFLLRDHQVDQGYGIRWNDARLLKQDHYKIVRSDRKKITGGWATLASKKDLVREYLDKPEKLRKQKKRLWVFNFLSGSTLMLPRDVAKATNEAAYCHLGPYRGKKNLGTVIMDFPGERLIYRIIKTNFKLPPSRGSPLDGESLAF